ncbi:DUF1232 domain-containing protein [Tissierella sp.]|uniref:YkvA family protein n=1 Tax=Tissierella sp. TaxID=41274 RepID=UPI00285717B8|nr:DUF1232 domain-containing protein [Tissierella sp.]MDR7855790.1 DUF1232 domain-containing protein [Tissierella sp.]
MKIDFNAIFRKLEGKANAISFDNARLKNLLESARQKAEGNKQIMEIWDDLKILIELIRDWMKGEYRDLNRSSVVMVIISLLYLVNPLDLIPDFIIGGFVDDLAVIAYVIKKISEELNLYKKWKNIDNNNNKDEEAEIFENTKDDDNIEVTEYTVYENEED